MYSSTTDQSYTERSMSLPSLSYSSSHIEDWLDNHPDFVENYFLRKANRRLVDKWIQKHATTTHISPSDSLDKQDIALPIRKISSQQFETISGDLQPMVRQAECGTPTFLELESSRDNSSESSLDMICHELSNGLDERELMWELIKDICYELDVDMVCYKILKNISALVQADRCSIFLVSGSEMEDTRCLVSQLFDVSCHEPPKLRVGDPQEKIRIAWGSGIAGHVAQHGKPIILSDAYQDERFDRTVDELTGYRTKSIMCLPITHSDGKILGVAQAINKGGNSPDFNSKDHQTFKLYLTFCGIVLRNVQLYERSRMENKRNQVLLDLAKIVCEEQCKLVNLTDKIMKHAQSLLQCNQCHIYLISDDTKMVFSHVYQYEASTEKTTSNEVRINGAENKNNEYHNSDNIDTEIACHVATTRSTVNICDGAKPKQFLSLTDRLRNKSILAVPIQSADSKRVLGVFQLTDKLDRSKFTQNDQQIFEAFAIFCGIGIENTIMYERVVQAQARQSVALEVLAYHAVAPNHQVSQLKDLKIPSALFFSLDDFAFSDFLLDDQQTLQATIRMFIDLEFIEKFHINYEVLCRWVLSVKKNYRDVPYHNWRHAFNVAQCMFASLKTGGLLEVVGDLEAMCLLVACLCHDLDHRGTNNQFLLKTESPLSRLYSTSVLEHHHFDHCIMLLNTAGNQIFSNLNQNTYEKAMNILEQAILSTDLALYFQRRKLFFDMVDDSTIVGKALTGKTGLTPSANLVDHTNCSHVDWDVSENRSLLFSMLMTSCDISAITKPWPVQQKVATLVASEFFQQGDLEREQLHLKPTAMMDRSRIHELPTLQVQFIDSICLPLYKRIAKLNTNLSPLLEGCEENRINWVTESEKASTPL